MLSRDSGASVKAEHVYDGFRNTFGENALGIILGIGQFGSSKNWIIQFKSESTFSSSLGKDILIGSQSFTLKDANEYYKSNTTLLLAFYASASIRLRYFYSGTGCKNT